MGHRNKIKKNREVGGVSRPGPDFVVFLLFFSSSFLRVSLFFFLSLSIYAMVKLRPFWLGWSSWTYPHSTHSSIHSSLFFFCWKDSHLFFSFLHTPFVKIVISVADWVLTFVSEKNQWGFRGTHDIWRRKCHFEFPAILMTFIAAKFRIETAVRNETFQERRDVVASIGKRSIFHTHHLIDDRKSKLYPTTE